ncbi:hypothetical protein [Levilactobacillus namurensis]|uniref:hypothetical protein n=1 Tax=Levilactobacillus namurensis TaxID=380393 RepID=UPI00222ED866|nr:hypothetical protein [Levilactobacillus namurensis]MCW3779092.1 hypothetical protein [Levilactobacillus namurensis]MDT7019924.1 hypothetical protein [Levilactobacillus namurensis]WNN65496.1 hypothetical protein RIN67_12565 [Levilactobacillus namurensis]
MSLIPEWLDLADRYQRISTALTQSLAGSAYTVKDYCVLYFLSQAKNQQLRLTDLQMRVGVSASTLLHLIRQLKARSPDVIQSVTNEQQEASVQLTVAGQAVLKTLTQQVERTLTPYLESAGQSNLVLAEALMLD